LLKVLKNLDQGIEKFSRIGLVVGVSGMLGLTLLGIVLRWFGMSWLWLEPVVRHLVFLSAFLGGALATGAGTHIGIDIASKVLEARHMDNAKRYVDIIVALMSFVICLWLTKAGIDLVQVEAEYGKAHFLGIHSAFLVGIMPFGFAIISYRSFYRFLAAVMGREY